MPGPKISTCIPVRNGAEWIDAAIDSALAQTREDFEILVVENASNDGTGDLVRRRSTEDSRIRLERFDHSVSAPANHNRAVQLARGGLVKFLHADDALYPDCLERMAAIFELIRRSGSSSRGAISCSRIRTTLKHSSGLAGTALYTKASRRLSR